MACHDVVDLVHWHLERRDANQRATCEDRSCQKGRGRVVGRLIGRVISYKDIARSAAFDGLTNDLG